VTVHPRPPGCRWPRRPGPPSGRCAGRVGRRGGRSRSRWRRWPASGHCPPTPGCSRPCGATGWPRRGRSRRCSGTSPARRRGGRGTGPPAWRPGWWRGHGRRGDVGRRVDGGAHRCVPAAGRHAVGRPVPTAGRAGSDAKAIGPSFRAGGSAPADVAGGASNTAPSTPTHRNLRYPGSVAAPTGAEGRRAAGGGPTSGTHAPYRADAPSTGSIPHLWSRNLTSTPARRPPTAGTIS